MSQNDANVLPCGTAAANGDREHEWRPARTYPKDKEEPIQTSTGVIGIGFRFRSSVADCGDSRIFRIAKLCKVGRHGWVGFFPLLENLLWWSTNNECNSGALENCQKRRKKGWFAVVKERRTLSYVTLIPKLYTAESSFKTARPSTSPNNDGTYAP
jgi:hypothetical protein